MISTATPAKKIHSFTVLPIPSLIPTTTNAVLWLNWYKNQIMHSGIGVAYSPSVRVRKPQGEPSCLRMFLSLSHTQLNLQSGFTTIQKKWKHFPFLPRPGDKLGRQFVKELRTLWLHTRNTKILSWNVGQLGRRRNYRRWLYQKSIWIEVTPFCRKCKTINTGHSRLLK